MRDQGRGKYHREQKLPWKGTNVPHFGLTDLSFGLRQEEYVKVDLHRKRSHQVQKAIAKGISDAMVKDLDVVVVVHGFNHGKVLRDESQRVLKELLQEKLITSYEVNPGNPGETVVRIP